MISSSLIGWKLFLGIAMEIITTLCQLGTCQFIILNILNPVCGIVTRFAACTGCILVSLIEAWIKTFIIEICFITCLMPLISSFFCFSFRTIWPPLSMGGQLCGQEELPLFLPVYSVVIAVVHIHLRMHHHPSYIAWVLIEDIKS